MLGLLRTAYFQRCMDKVQPKEMDFRSLDVSYVRLGVDGGGDRLGDERRPYIRGEVEELCI